MYSKFPELAQSEKYGGESVIRSDFERIKPPKLIEPDLRKVCEDYLDIKQLC